MAASYSFPARRVTWGPTWALSRRRWPTDKTRQKRSWRSLHRERPLGRGTRDSMINGRTEIIAHLGYPTETFTAPMIYNPWFASRGINAVVVPMGARAEDYVGFLRPLFRLSNIRGA